MVSKYETEVDPNNRNTSHGLILDLVGQDNEVLDVGTSTGYVAKHLVRRGCRVTGIELDPEAARKAEEYCERVIVGDVESLDLGERLGRASFDVIVFGDVLEHLKDPLSVLRRFKPFLRPGGRVIASVPNIAHGSVRLALLQGRFQYNRLGLLDNTHLRFFTRESLEQMFDDAGFMVGEMERTTVGIFDTEIEVDRAAVTEETVEAIRQDPESETYQFVLMAYPVNAIGEEQTTNGDQTLPDQLVRRDRMIYELTRELRNLEELRRQLTRRDEHLAQKKREVAELRQQVNELTRQLTREERQKERQFKRGGGQREEQSRADAG